MAVGAGRPTEGAEGVASHLPRARNRYNSHHNLRELPSAIPVVLKGEIKYGESSFG